jgi:glutaredoxin
MKPAVTLYTRVNCCLCDVVKGLLDEVRTERLFELTTIDVDSDPELVRLYGEEVPVVAIDGRKSFKLRVDPAALRAALARADGAGR